LSRRVERAEDGGVCADAECEREDGGDGETGCFDELPEGVAEILKKDGHAKPPTEGSDLARC